MIKQKQKNFFQISTLKQLDSAGLIVVLMCSLCQFALPNSRVPFHAKQLEANLKVLLQQQCLLQLQSEALLTNNLPTTTHVLFP